MNDYYLVTDIEWDTDDEDFDESSEDDILELPTTMEVPIEALLEEGETEDNVDDDDLEERIGDYLSDQTGFCHYGFSFERMSGKREG